MPSLPRAATRSKGGRDLGCRVDRVDEGPETPRAKRGHDLALEGAHRRRLLLERPGAQHRPLERRALEHEGEERHLDIAPGGDRDDDDPAAKRDGFEVCREMRRLRRARGSTCAPAPVVAARTAAAKPSSSSGSPPSSRTSFARGVAPYRREDAGACGDPELDGGCPDPAGTRRARAASRPGRNPACVKAASCAVTNVSTVAAAAPARRASRARGPGTARARATRSASPPPPTSPKTRSPGCQARTWSPQRSTVPATSRPGTSGGLPGGAG